MYLGEIPGQWSMAGPLERVWKSNSWKIRDKAWGTSMWMDEDVRIKNKYVGITC